jgi:hypothetical protein
MYVVVGSGGGVTTRTLNFGPLLKMMKLGKTSKADANVPYPLAPLQRTYHQDIGWVNQINDFTHKATARRWLSFLILTTTDIHCRVKLI